jgi:hypothetical protein
MRASHFGWRLRAAYEGHENVADELETGRLPKHIRLPFHAGGWQEILYLFVVLQARLQVCHTDGRPVPGDPPQTLSRNLPAVYRITTAKKRDSCDHQHYIRAHYHHLCSCATNH